MPAARAVLPLVLAAVAALSAGCGAPTDAEGSRSLAAPPSSSSPPPSSSDEPAAQEYRYTGYAIGPTDADEVTLCGSTVLESLPPQCGDGVLAQGWDWSQVDAQAASGVSFGEVEAVGTWDGATSTLTLTRPPETYQQPAPRPQDQVDFSTPCPEPAGGWGSLAPTDADRADFDAAFAAVPQVEGYLIAWMDRNPGTAPPEWMVLNVRTAGDVAAMEAAAREHWSGPLCVTGGAQRSAAELAAIRDEVRASHPDLVSVEVLELEQRVAAQAWVVPDGLQAELDSTYGAGTVEVHGFLEPVD